MNVHAYVRVADVFDQIARVWHRKILAADDLQLKNLPICHALRFVGIEVELWIAEDVGLEDVTTTAIVSKESLIQSHRRVVGLKVESRF